MAENDITSRRIAGANACIEALRKLEHAAQHIHNKAEDTYREYIHKRRDDAQALAAALGPLQPEAEGAIRSLAEYILTGLDAGEPNLEPGKWLPTVCMTEAELEQKIVETIAEHEKEDAECDARLAERRNRPLVEQKAPPPKTPEELEVDAVMSVSLNALFREVDAIRKKYQAEEVTATA